jgi:hypothetical protein
MCSMSMWIVIMTTSIPLLWQSLMRELNLWLCDRAFYSGLCKMVDEWLR